MLNENEGYSPVANIPEFRQLAAENHLINSILNRQVQNATAK